MKSQQHALNSLGKFVLQSIFKTKSKFPDSVGFSNGFPTRRTIETLPVCTHLINFAPGVVFVFR